MGVVAAIAAAAGAVTEIVSKGVETRQRVEALRRQQQQIQIQADNQKLERSDQLEKTVSAARAEEAARGLSLGSASFSAIQSNSFNDFARDERITNLNTNYKIGAINNEISNINGVEAFDDLGAAFGAAAGIAGAHTPSPKESAPLQNDPETEKDLSDTFGAFDKKEFPTAFNDNMNFTGQDIASF